MTYKGPSNSQIPEPYRTLVVELVRALVIVVKALRAAAGIPDKPV